MNVATPPLYTIGYQGLDCDTFLQVLGGAGVETLVDIRERPQSRKADFSKRALARRLEDDAIGYLHVRELGCPAAIRNRFKKEGDWKRYTREFGEWLQSQTDAVSAIADLSRQRAVALMCFEADVERCHRLFVAHAVVALTGAETIHLQS